MQQKATIEFFWLGAAPQNAASVPESADRVYYTGFNLNGVSYQVGEYVLLYPEEEASLHYVAKVVKCFHDKSGAYGDPHCVEVAWFERAAVLEATARDSREVVELEETDVNPIGCISGKACVLKASNAEEAAQLAQASVPAGCEWFWCARALRAGVLLPCAELADQTGVACRQQETPVQHSGKRSLAGSGSLESVADSGEEADAKRSRVTQSPEEMPSAPVRRTGKLVSGRTCVECGATQTPQWREGPAGPKTLCNACGVRYVRAQQRANKRAVSMGMSRPSSGSGGRQSRASKGARTEPASGPRGRAATTAAAVEEVSQRPLRQAALLAANKTAQYARTGVFPQSATELQHQHQQPYAASAPEVELAAAGRPGTPLLCSSATASADGSASADTCLPEGVTVEVVVDGGEADGCCDGAAAMSPAMGLVAAPYSALVPLPAVPGGYPQQMPMQMPHLTHLTHMGAMLQGAAPCCPERPATAMGGAATSAAAPACGAAVQQGGMVPLAGHVVLLGAAAAAPAAAAAVPAAADTNSNTTPSASGSGSGLAAGDCCASELPAAALHHHGMSVPVSPSNPQPASAAAYDMFVSGEEDGSDVAAASAYGGAGCQSGGAGLLEDQDHAFGSLMAMGGEVDVDVFGLVGADVSGEDGGAALFDVLLQPGGACDGADGACESLVVGVCDLPDVAARAAPYCPDLAPGTAARQLLDAAPLLLHMGGGEDAGAGARSSSADAAGVTVAGGAEAEAALRQLVDLGAEADRAATEALAATEAAEAVEQAAEAAAEAARAARDAAACNLERLREAISGIAGPEAAAAVALDCSSLIELPHGLGDGGAAGLGLGLGLGLGSGCLFDDATLVAVHS